MKTVYTKQDCPACVTLKTKLRQIGEDFVEIEIGKDMTREDFLMMYPHVRSVPYIVDDDY